MELVLARSADMLRQLEDDFRRAKLRDSDFDTPEQNSDRHALNATRRLLLRLSRPGREPATPKPWPKVFLPDRGAGLGAFLDGATAGRAAAEAERGFRDWQSRAPLREDVTRALEANARSSSIQRAVPGPFVLWTKTEASFHGPGSSPARSPGISSGSAAMAQGQRRSPGATLATAQRGFGTGRS